VLQRVLQRVLQTLHAPTRYSFTHHTHSVFKTLHTRTHSILTHTPSSYRGFKTRRRVRQTDQHACMQELRQGLSDSFAEALPIPPHCQDQKSHTKGRHMRRKRQHGGWLISGYVDMRISSCTRLFGKDQEQRPTLPSWHVQNKTSKRRAREGSAIPRLPYRTTCS